MGRRKLPPHAPLLRWGGALGATSGFNMMDSRAFSAALMLNFFLTSDLTHIGYAKVYVFPR